MVPAIVVVMRERTPLTESILARLPDLRLVVTTGSRNAAIDLAACRGRGITVCGTASRSAPPAELTWALVLGLLRGVRQEAAAMREGGPWQSTVGRDLAGATFGVIGLGKIGTRVAKVARAFDMDVMAWSPHLTEERAGRGGVRLAASKRDLLFNSDVVSLHLKLSWSTRRIIDAGDIAAMRRSAYFVNTARAGLVDNDALVAALQQGRLAGAGLDVFDEEPLPADHPLRTLPNVLALPHLGYVTGRQLPHLLHRGRPGHRGLDRGRAPAGHLRSSDDLHRICRPQAVGCGANAFPRLREIRQCSI